MAVINYQFPSATPPWRALQSLGGKARHSKIFLGNGDGANWRKEGIADTQADCHSSLPDAGLQSLGLLGAKQFSLKLKIQVSQLPSHTQYQPESLD
jgi:hypothetical protein